MTEDEAVVAESSQPQEPVPGPKLEPKPDRWPEEAEPAVTSQVLAGEEGKAVEEKRVEERVAEEEVMEEKEAEGERVVKEKAEEPRVEGGSPRSPPSPRDTRSVKVEDGDQLGEMEEDSSKAAEEQVREKHSK